MTRPLFFALALALSGCGAGGGSATSGAAAAPAAQPVLSSDGTGKAYMTITIPRVGQQAVDRHATWVSPSTASMTVTPSNGTPQTFALNPNFATPPCTELGSPASTYTCPVSTGTGTGITFSVVTRNASNTILSQGVSAPVTIAASNPTPINVVMQGIPVTLQLSTTNLGNLPYGPRAVVGLLAKDASNNVITSGTYAVPINLSGGDAHFGGGPITTFAGSANAIVFDGSTAEPGNVIVTASCTTCNNSPSVTLGTPYHAAYALDRGAHVYFIDRQNLTVKANYSVVTITLPAVGSGLAISPDGGLMYVTDEANNTVHAVDLQTTPNNGPHEFSTIAATHVPHQLVVLPDTHLFVAQTGGPPMNVTVVPAPSAVDITGTVVGSTHAVAMSPNGSVYAGDDPNGVTQSYVIKSDPPFTAATASFVANPGSYGLAVDMTRIYLAAMSAGNTTATVMSNPNDFSGFGPSATLMTGIRSPDWGQVMALQAGSLYVLNASGGVSAFALPALTGPNTPANLTATGLSAIAPGPGGGGLWLGGNMNVYKYDVGMMTQTAIPVGGVIASIAFGP